MGELRNYKFQTSQVRRFCRGNFQDFFHEDNRNLMKDLDDQCTMKKVVSATPGRHHLSCLRSRQDNRNIGGVEELDWIRTLTVSQCSFGAINRSWTGETQRIGRWQITVPFGAPAVHEPSDTLQASPPWNLATFGHVERNECIHNFWWYIFWLEASKVS